MDSFIRTLDDLSWPKKYYSAKFPYDVPANCKIANKGYHMIDFPSSFPFLGAALVNKIINELWTDVKSWRICPLDFCLFTWYWTKVTRSMQSFLISAIKCFTSTRGTEMNSHLLLYKTIVSGILLSLKASKMDNEASLFPLECIKSSRRCSNLIEWS